MRRSVLVVLCLICGNALVISHLVDIADFKLDRDGVVDRVVTSSGVRIAVVTALTL